MSYLTYSLATQRQADLRRSARQAREARTTRTASHATWR